MKRLNKITSVIATMALLSLTTLSNPALADNELKLNQISIMPKYESLNISIKSENIEEEEGLQTTIFGLPQNMGPIDRSLRGVIAAGLLGTGIYGLSTGAITKEASWTMIGVSAIPIATASTGYCPLYQVFGLKYSF